MSVITIEPEKTLSKRDLVLDLETLKKVIVRGGYWSRPDDTPVSVEIAAFMLNRSPRTLEDWRREEKGPNYIRTKPITYLVGDLREYHDRMKVRLL